MDNQYIYGSANRMLRKAMQDYGIPTNDQQTVDQFGSIEIALTAVKAVGPKLMGWIQNNPDKVAEIGGGIVKGITSSKSTESRGRRTTRKAKRAQKSAPNYDEALIAKLSQYIGEYTTMLGEMRRQLTQNGILDPNAQNEVARNAFAAELYDNPPADQYKKNVLKMLVYRMDKNLKRAYKS